MLVNIRLPKVLNQIEAASSTGFSKRQNKWESFQNVEYIKKTRGLQKMLDAITAQSNASSNNEGRKKDMRQISVLRTSFDSLDLGRPTMDLCRRPETH